MEQKKTIISYRRRCTVLGQGTGLSHYIFLTPREESVREGGDK